MGYSPEDLALFQQQLAGQTQDDAWLGNQYAARAPDESAMPYTPPPEAPGLLDRSGQSAGRLARNPAALVAAGPGALGLAGGGLSQALGTAPAAGGAEDAASRATVVGPNDEQLRPMWTPAANVQASPTLAQQAAAQGQGGMGAGGQGGGGALKTAWDESRQKQLEDFGTDKRLTHRLGNEQAQRVESIAALQELDAQRKQRDADLQAEADKKADDRHQAFLMRSEELTNDVGKMQIDPERFIRDKGVAGAMAMAVGGFLGGYLQGSQGLASNPFLSQIDKLIDRDIASQQSAIDNKKAELSARNNLFGQMLQETGDHRVATLQTRNLLYEATKQKLLADADRLGIPEGKTRAAMAAQDLQHKQDALKEQMSKEAYATYMAQAAASANAQRAAEDKTWQRYKDLAEMALKRDELNIKATEAEGKGGVAERFVATGQDEQGNPSGYVARNPQEAALKEKQRSASQQLIGLIENAQKLRNDQGVLGRAGARMSPVDLEYQTRLKSLQGDMTGAYKEAKQLGALDAGTQKLADTVIGDLDSVGSSADSRLDQLKSNLSKGIETEDRNAAGQKAVKAVDPRTGREMVLFANKLNSPRSDMPHTVKVNK